MATRYTPGVVSALPVVGFPRPASAPVSRTATPAIGGGASPVVSTMDPRSLVPVNRVQPVATDGGAARRLVENRTGYSPPSSFSGAGSAYAPAASPPPVVTSVAPPPPMSADAVNQAANAEMMYANNIATPGAGEGDGIYYTTTGQQRGWDGSSPGGNRMETLLARLEGKVPAEALARIRARLEARAAAGGPQTGGRWGAPHQFSDRVTDALARAQAAQEAALTYRVPAVPAPTGAVPLTAESLRQMQPGQLRGLLGF